MMPTPTDRQAAIALVRAAHRLDDAAVAAALDHDHPRALALAVAEHLVFALRSSDLDVERWLDQLSMLNLQADYADQ